MQKEESLRSGNPSKRIKITGWPKGEIYEPPGRDWDPWGLRDGSIDLPFKPIEKNRS